MEPAASETSARVRMMSDASARAAFEAGLDFLSQLARSAPAYLPCRRQSRRRRARSALPPTLARRHYRVKSRPRSASAARCSNTARKGPSINGLALNLGTEKQRKTVSDINRICTALRAETTDLRAFGSLAEGLGERASSFGYGVLAKASTCTSRSGSVDCDIGTTALSGEGGPK